MVMSLEAMDYSLVIGLYMCGEVWLERLDMDVGE